MPDQIGLHPLSSEERDALIDAWAEPSPDAVLAAEPWPGHFVRLDTRTAA